MPRLLRFKRPIRRRAYCDRTIAQTLQALLQNDSAAQTADDANIPRGTLNAWKNRYLKDDGFAERIDKALRDSKE